MLTLLSCLMKHTFRRCSSGIQSLEGLRAEHQIRAQTRRNENCFSSGTHKKVQICNFNTRKKDEILLQYKQSIRTQIRMPIKINIQMRGSRNSNRILFHLYTYISRKTENQREKDFSLLCNQYYSVCVYIVYIQQATTKPIYTCQTLGTRLKPRPSISPFLHHLSPEKRDGRTDGRTDKPDGHGHGIAGNS